MSVLSSVRRAVRTVSERFGIEPKLLRVSPDLLIELTERFGDAMLVNHIGGLMLRPGMFVDEDRTLPPRSFRVGFVAPLKWWVGGMQLWDAVVTIREEASTS